MQLKELEERGKGVNQKQYYIPHFMLHAVSDDKWGKNVSGGKTLPALSELEQQQTSVWSV